jgi:4-amino-4-deoxy-L-arabinose transferase-like glycosyltransferase
MNFWDVALCFALIAVCLMLVGILYKNNGVNYTFDDVGYLKYAGQILNGTFSPLQSPYAYGYMLPLTIAVSYKLFGISNFSASVPSIIEYALLVIIAYFTVLKLFRSRKIAFIGALGLAFSAFVAVYSSRPLPDMFIGDAVALAIYFSLFEDKRYFILSGLSMSAIVFFKLGAIIPALGMLVGLIILKSRIRAVYYFIGLFTGLMLYFLSVGTLGIITTYSATQIGLAHTQVSLVGNLMTMLYLMLFGYDASAQAFLQTFTLGFLFLYAILGSWLVIKKKKSELYLILFVFWFTFFYLFLGTEGLTRYSLIITVSRYFIWVSVPMCILASFFIYTVSLAGTKKRISMLLLMLIILSNLLIILFFATHLINYA